MTRVTIKTIAEAVGVTHGTVSRALRDDPRVRQETTKLVKQKAAELGYRPSRVGRALKTRKTGTLAIVLSYAHDPFYSQVLQAVHDRLFPLEISLFVAATEHDPARQRVTAEILSERMVDGVFVCCLPGMTEPFLQLSKTLPVVTINCDPQIYPYSVYHDDFKAMGDCLKMLTRKGHRKVGYLGAQNGGFAQRTRLDAFNKFCRELSLHPTVRTADDVKIEVGAEAMEQWLEKDELPSALVCFNDTMAIGAMNACRKRGLRIPEDISLVGFDDIEMAAYLNPGLTTYSQPRYEMGRIAAEMMLALQSGKTPEAPVCLSGKLIERETVAHTP